MCSSYMPKQGKKGRIVFGAEHLFTSHTFSYNHVISGCFYLTIQPFEQRRKSNSCIKDEPITVLSDFFLTVSLHRFPGSLMFMIVFISKG